MDVITKSEAIVEPVEDDDRRIGVVRRLADDAVALLHESESTRLMTPSRYGGRELSPRALVEAERVIAHGSPAAAWVLMVTGAHTFISRSNAGRGPGRRLRQGPRHVDPRRSEPRGTCAPTDGGYLLNGRWPYASGADHGDWVMVGARGIENEAGERAPALLVVIPKEKVVIDDTWFTLGIRGTGSKDIVLDDVFVPERHTVDMVEGMSGTVPGVESRLYQLPIRATLSTMLLGAIVGMAERGLDLFIEQTHGRSRRVHRS